MKSICFLHIEKAAGTTLNEIMRNNFYFYYAVSPYLFNKNIDNQDFFLKKEELNVIRKLIPNFVAYGGHSVRLYEDYGEDMIKFTFVRNPVDRYLSHYFYQKQVMKVDWSIEEYLRHENFNNFMCKKICGFDSFEKAKKIIDGDDVFVGVLEKFDESLILLKKFVDESQSADDFVINYEVRNANTNKQGRELQLLMNDYIDRINDNNKEDIKLYKYAEKKVSDMFCGMGDATLLLEKFRSSNKGFKFNRANIIGYKLFKRLYLNRLERRVRDVSKLELSF